jgi:hydrogenase assembly chaperone HypC/HupF
VTFPGRVIAVDDFGATVETEGRLRRASTIVVPEVAVGDWVVVAAGSIMQRLDPEVATSVREILLQAIALEEGEPLAQASDTSVSTRA